MTSLAVNLPLMPLTVENVKKFEQLTQKQSGPKNILAAIGIEVPEEKGAEENDKEREAKEAASQHAKTLQR